MHLPGPRNAARRRHGGLAAPNWRLDIAQRAPLPRKHLISLAFESNAAVDIQNQVIESAPNAPMSTKDRYDVIMEPTDTWTVWDLVNDEPAMFGDHVLAALTQVEAMAARDVMNDAWRRLQEGALQRHVDAA